MPWNDLTRIVVLVACDVRNDAGAPVADPNPQAGRFEVVRVQSERGLTSVGYFDSLRGVITSQRESVGQFVKGLNHSEF